MKQQKVVSALGLAQKAGKIISGEFAVEKAIRSRRVKLLLVAKDSSENTKKAYRNMAEFYKIPLYEILSREVLGSCIGKHNRAALAIVDEGFKQVIDSALSDC
ncbi:hypothetical protein P22_2221 [Propionispora sp. 2/2-37]|uniref:L7Ae/L30e/S12e/Gadd45 family ribosomal protein n=1 Tax=Propionispora sp. 2/2-37 TaxID=1677858 RepID=UPI0006BB9720|nr:ribosomal L7Ae/L30e/S12e/Gadd45 family protein [Propionispora sp. 2/2-37]CUH96133.1 hypothetical protein P22_2221 [Propionispora sp. 2/2-37]